MKKNIFISGILSLIIFLSLSDFTFGQWEYTGTTPLPGHISSLKNIGIGISAPQSGTKLDIVTSLTSASYNYGAFSNNTVNATNISATINSRLGNSSNYGAYASGFGLVGYIYGVNRIKAATGTTATLAGGNFSLVLANPTVDVAGNYQIAGCMATLTGFIGTYPTNKIFAGLYAVDGIKNNLNTWAGYFDGNVCVTGTIRTTEVKIKVSPWADFVFEESYKLPSLTELDKFIKLNRHLPGIPKAKEVQEEGVSLGEMNANLLQKVEELTLYIIQQDKRITELEKKLGR